MKHRTSRDLALCLALGLTACATYEPSPLEVRAVLDELEAVQWAAPPSFASANEAQEQHAPGPRELAAFAIDRNPTLVAVRAEWDVNESLLVEAGLLPDPELGWDAMDVLSSQITDGTSSSGDVIAGFGLMFPLLRPGELDAREGAAQWRLEEVSQRITAAEWELTRQIFVACERLTAAQQLAQQTAELTQLMGSTADFFRRAKDAGAVTAIEANLALGEHQAMKLKGIRARASVQRAQQTLNGLLGLPPTTVLEVAPSERPSERQELQLALEELTSHAVDHRPDLGQLQALYEVREQELRLAIAQQYPLFAIGTGIQMTLPIFSKFGAAAIRTAEARREQLAREFKAAVHAAREQIAAEHTLWELAQSEVQMVEDELLPNAEQTLALSRESFEAGAITLLETLALQRALVEARTRQIETRAARAEHAWNLLAASGWLLTSDTAQDQDQPQTDEN